jgi:excisionase family DNA binding protein
MSEKDRVRPVPGGHERLLTPGEVAVLFRVDPKTVTRWASAGRLGSIRTPGGHRRFREAEVRALLGGAGPAPVRDSAHSPHGAHGARVSDVTVPEQATGAGVPAAG